MELSLLRDLLSQYEDAFMKGSVNITESTLGELDGIRNQAVLWNDQRSESTAINLITYGSLQKRINTIVLTLFSTPLPDPDTITAELARLQNELSTRLSPPYPTHLKDDLRSYCGKTQHLASRQNRLIIFLSQMDPREDRFLLELQTSLLARKILAEVPDLEKKLALHTVFNAPDSFGKRLLIISLQNP